MVINLRPLWRDDHHLLDPHFIYVTVLGGFDLGSNWTQVTASLVIIWVAITLAAKILP